MPFIPLEAEQASMGFTPIDEPDTGFTPIEQEASTGFTPIESATGFTPIEAEAQTGFTPIAEEESSIGDWAVGIGEGIMSFGSGAIGAPVGGIAGAGTALMEQDASEASKTIEKVSSALTYEPRTKEGMAVLEAISYPFEKLAELGEYLGGKTVDLTDSPVAGAGVNAAFQVFAPLGVFKGGAKGVHTVKGRKQVKANEAALDVAPEIAAKKAELALKEELGAKAVDDVKLPSVVYEAPEGAVKKPLAAGIAEATPKGQSLRMPPEIAKEPFGLFMDDAMGRAPGSPPLNNPLTWGDKALRVSRGVMDWTGGKAITPVRRLAEHSPAFKFIADKMEAPDFVKKGEAPVGATFYERVNRQTGKMTGKLNDILGRRSKQWNLREDPKGIGRFRMTPNEQAQVISGLRGGSVSANLKPIVRDLRNWLNEQRAYMVKAGVKIGEIEDYFPRIYDVKAIAADQGRGLQAVFEKHGIPREVAAQAVKDIAANKGILDPEGMKLNRKYGRHHEDKIELGIAKSKAKVTDGSNMRGTKASAEKARKFDQVPDAELAPYLTNNLHKVLSDYSMRGTRRAEWTRDFGVDGVKLNNKIKKGIKELEAKGEHVPREAIDRVYDLSEAMQHNYKPIKSQLAQGANSFVGAYQLIRTLPMATLSSLAEPFVILMRTDFKYFGSGALKGAEHAVNSAVRTMSKKVGKSEYTRAVEDIGIGADAGMMESLTAAYGGEVNAATAMFFKVNVLHQWTRLNRVIANEAGKSMIQGHLERMAGKKDYGIVDRFFKAETKKRHVRELEDLGIDIPSGLKWIEEGAKKTDPFYESVVNGGMRFTNNVVMNPRATNRPMWHSNPHLHLISQLKGFQTVFGNTVMKNLWQEATQHGVYNGIYKTTKNVTTASIMMYVMYQQEMLRNFLQTGFGEWEHPHAGDPKSQAFRAFDRSGFGGVLSILKDSTLSHEFGGNPLATILGPTASQTGDVLQATGRAISGKPKSLQKQGVKAIPLASGVRPVREGLYEAFGIED